jgi:hypothetical protein
MTFLGRLFRRRQRRNDTDSDGELSAQVRGETKTLKENKRAVRDERLEYDTPTRGGNWVGR